MYIDFMYARTNAFWDDLPVTLHVRYVDRVAPVRLLTMYMYGKARQPLRTNTYYARTYMGLCSCAPFAGLGLRAALSPWGDAQFT